jgi:hypothetical protein
LDALTHAHWLFSERDIDRRRGEGIIRKMASLSSTSMFCEAVN